MPRTQGLSPARHRAIGPELARIRDQLAEISAEVMKAWPRRSVVSDRASAVVEPVDRLRDELDARFRVEHEGDYSPDAYCPPRAVRDAPGLPSPAVQHATAVKVAAACQAAREAASADAKDAATQALLGLAEMHLAIAEGDAGKADLAMMMAVSWAETARRESGTSS
jgi:hypothetical protein